MFLESLCLIECLSETMSGLFTLFWKDAGWEIVCAADKIMEMGDRDGANSQTLREEARKDASSKAGRSQQIKQMQSIFA